MFHGFQSLRLSGEGSSETKDVEGGILVGHCTLGIAMCSAQAVHNQGKYCTYCNYAQFRNSLWQHTVQSTSSYPVWGSMVCSFSECMLAALPAKQPPQYIAANQQLPQNWLRQLTTSVLCTVCLRQCRQQGHLQSAAATVFLH